MNLAPIILFVYNRPEHTKKTLEALEKNKLASQSCLYIFADGPKGIADNREKEKIAEVRKIIRSKTLFKSKKIYEKEKNQGLALSIISGVTTVINEHGRAIVLEDDIITGPYFLQFMNESLDIYFSEKKIWHITGWCENLQLKKNDYAWLYPVMDCWGWATWDDRWKYFNNNTDFFIPKFSKKMIKEFNINGCDKLKWLQILYNASGKLNTWAIFWYATIFLNTGLCLAPSSSLVDNVGFDGSGTNCGKRSKKESMSINYEIKQFPKEIKTYDFEYKKLQRYLRKQNSFILKILKEIIHPIQIWKKRKIFTKKFKQSIS